MSSCSIEYDENVAKQFERTPGTPIKVTHQTPKRSSRKRSLFQPSSPCSSSSKSDDLGPMSPLSASSTDSYVEYQSPSFSPNGRFSTPPKTPVQNYMLDRCNSRRKKDITSNVFPSLKIETPKSHKSTRPLRRSERLTPLKDKSDNSVTSEDALGDMTTPPTLFRRMNLSEKTVNNSDKMTDTVKNARNSMPHCGTSGMSTTPVSKLGIKNLPCESFYGSLPPTPKVRTQLFIDSLGSKADIRKRTRSLSVESLSSNRSFVSGSGPAKKRKVSDVGSRPKASRKSRERGPLAGVWHGVKKPKKMKFATNVNKPLISPKTRLAKMLNPQKTNPIKMKSKSCREEKPRQKKDKRSPSLDDNEIFDPFPHHLIKRKKLPSQPHPSSDMQLVKEDDTPDPNKKFMKFKKMRNATLTLNGNVKLRYSDGVISLQSPKKRRKLYSGKNDVIFDFPDDDVKNTEVKENIENILLQLENDKEMDTVNNFTDGIVTTPSKTQITKITEDQLVDILNNPGTKVNIVKGSPSKVLTEIQNDSGNNIFLNSPTAIKELSSQAESCVDNKNKDNGIGLEETSNILSSTRHILSNPEQTHMNPLSDEGESPKTSQEKFFSLFYKHNWNNAIPAKDAAVTKSCTKKKSMKIPDDQYLLDAGQKSIGIVTCGKCGVMYQAGDFADEATHKNFHDHLPELRFTGWANERVVGRFRDGRVIMIVSSDSKSWWHKVTKIVDIVDQELGFPEGSVNALYYKTVYLYINDKAKQIVGCLIAEKCKEAFKMFPPLEGVDVDSCSKDPSPCKVGISRIWTALNHRRRGVAKRMIDCMRRTFIYGEIVPMDLVAFSVPSPSGKLLAQNVTGKLDFLVYGFV